MPLGGGTFLTQNKILPGTYMNFISLARASATLADRGIATIPITSDWGAIGSVITVTPADLQRDSLKLFGYDYTAPQLMPLREMYRNIQTGYLYRLGTGGIAATNTYGTAKYVGIRGNDITIIVAENIDDDTLIDVTAMLGSLVLGTQTVATAADLVDDDFVIYNKTSTLDPTAGMPMAGGTNPAVSNADHQAYITAIESYNFNAIGCPSDDATIKDLYAAFTRRMRDDQGVKFQCVCYSEAADYEGVINILNTVTDVGADTYSLVYWVTGVTAGTQINKSASNKAYDGEYTIDASQTNTQLAQAIKDGKFAFYRTDSGASVLSDINSLVTLTDEKGEVFQANQTIRIIDSIGNDIALLFNSRYDGKVPNDDDGRASLWGDIVLYYEQMQRLRAIEDFDSGDVTVEQGATKKAVVVTSTITVINAMEQLYMTTVVA